MQYLDLHTHTCCSDGEVLPERLLADADASGLSLMAITDHNTVAAYDAVAENRRLFRGKILPGVELTTTFRNEVIEILGYGIDIATMRAWIGAHYLSFREKQVKAAKSDTLAMLAHGVTLDDEYVRLMCESPDKLFDTYHKNNRNCLLPEIKRHPENMRFFKDREEFETITVQSFTRDYIYNAKSTLFSDQSILYPSLEDVIGAIRQSGGLVFLAHPFVYSENIIRALDEIAAYGFDGMECFYGTFTPEQKQFMCAYCEKNGLFQSGGSDFHGMGMRPNNRLGYAVGEKITFDLIAPWFGKVEKSLL